jgi:hypothetical protein
MAKAKKPWQFDAVRAELKMNEWAKKALAAKNDGKVDAARKALKKYDFWKAKARIQ